MLELNHVAVERDGKEIIKDLNLKMEPNSILSVIGTNGTGKSTLAYTIMGLYPIKKGSIVFRGEDISKAEVWERARLGITLGWQEPARFEGISVKKFMRICAEQGCVLGDEEEALRSVGLNPDKYMDRAVDETLSGGERKRIELASVLLMKPALAILDEPDSGIDMATFDTIVEAIESLRSKGSSVILITHHPEILKIADRAALMCKNTILKQGTPDEVATFFEEECMPCDVEDYTMKEDKAVEAV